MLKLKLIDQLQRDSEYPKVKILPSIVTVIGLRNTQTRRRHTIQYYNKGTIGSYSDVRSHAYNYKYIRYPTILPSYLNNKLIIYNNQYKYNYLTNIRVYNSSISLCGLMLLSGATSQTLSCNL